jgi:N-formylglutamate deformylase
MARWQEKELIWGMASAADYFGFPVSQLHEPAMRRHGVLFNSPHSGRLYPKSFLAETRLDRRMIRRSEDVHVDSLFAEVVEQGYLLHTAMFPRAYVDVNREPYELDPRMFDGPLPPYANTGTARVAGGLGSIPRVVGEGIDIYAHRLPVGPTLERIDQIYKPFHQALRRHLQSLQEEFGYCLLIDCHSMPSSVRSGERSATPDIIIGDRFGASALAWISDLAVETFQSLGFSVTRNKPYAGGYITEHYGRPARNSHALQIEVNRGLYLDETTLLLTSGFASLRQAIGRFALAFGEEVGSNLHLGRLAAE